MNRAPDRLRGIGIGNFEIGIEINGLHVETGTAHAVVLRAGSPYAGVGRSTPPEVCGSTVPVYDRPYSDRRGTHVIGKIGNRAIARRLAVGIGQNDRKREIARLGDVFEDEIGEVIAGRKNALQSRDADLAGNVDSDAEGVQNRIDRLAVETDMLQAPLRR